MSTIIYSNNKTSKQILIIVLNILSLVKGIYFSKSLLSNPISCFLFYLIFYFIIIGFFISLPISSLIKKYNDEEISLGNIQEEEIPLGNIQKEEPINIVEKGKYKLLQKKFKKLQKEFRATKNEINDIKKKLLMSKQYETTISSDEISDIEPYINDLNQEFVDNIRDIPDEEILDDIINQNNFEIIQKQ